MIWRAEVVDQLDLYWQMHLAPRLAGLTDDEYFWEPVKDCWSLRTAADGKATLDGMGEVPDPPPVTTIAWRMTHVAFHVLGIRSSAHFGDGSLTMDTARLPVTAEDAVATLERHYRGWRDAVAGLDGAALARSIGEAEGEWAKRPMATLMLHVNREVMHHGAEICLLRDLYRANFS
ncbi:DinB family protein [Dactylosporangium sp. NBC_01737]|jgi:hypothetical protein|uniref:DinB family protein n=1 Tax=Dactylosporangium sp. NBC_01737 TaxID=2975959 RepID=UPI002E10A11E|nr:DinB family protein [Dactylosporangium sp. NBC_01737]